MSSFFGSLVNSLNSSRSKSVDDDMAICYNLYVHHNECLDIDDDVMEPPAFQIPTHMKWEDILGLVIGEIGCTDKTQFSYLDDEGDEIRIDSQEEYETALRICQKERRDLHIYNVRSRIKTERMMKKKPKKNAKEGFAILPDRCVEEPETDPVCASTEQRKSDVSNRSLAVNKLRVKPPEGAVGGEPIQMEDVTSSFSEDARETKPHPPSNSLLSLIRKEARKMAAEEVKDIWAFVNALKRDINTELDGIGEQLVQLRTPEAVEPVRSNSIDEGDSPHSSISSIASSQVEGCDFEASVVCQSLPDDSVVKCGTDFEKHWVFRNDGNSEWDHDTRLHLIEESCEPPAGTGSSLSDWGSRGKSVAAPALRPGHTGVLVVKLLAPVHPCEYLSLWKLSHSNVPFGPTVTCNVRIEEQKSDSPSERSLDSFVQVQTPKADSEVEADDERSAVEASNVRPEESSQPREEQLQLNDYKVAPFNADDIRAGERTVDTADQEAPAVDGDDTVENATEKNAGAGVEVEDESPLSDTPLPVATQSEAEEEPKTLENEMGQTRDEVENDVENFTEPHAHSFSSDDESDAEDEPEEDGSDAAGPDRASSEDLQSVDFALDEEPPSMTSFVVVPLPDCFDVNKPLNESQYDEEDASSDSAAGQEEDETPSHDEESDPEPDSQPQSATHPENSSIPETETRPKSTAPPQIVIPPNPDAAGPPSSGGVTPQSVDNESLTERIHKEFDEFLANPDHPVECPATKPKVPMNQLPSAAPAKIVLYAPEPKPVPASVLNTDAPYRIPNSAAAPPCPPFEQGWRQNPIPVPQSVVDTTPWSGEKPTPAPRAPTRVPVPCPETNAPPLEFAGVFPSEPFAVASPSDSLQDHRQTQERLRLPQIPSLEIAGGVSSDGPGTLPDEDQETFHTPPPSIPSGRSREVAIGPLDQLYEMGFHDIDLNQDIFKQCGGDLTRTVQALVLRADADRHYNQTA